MNMASQQPETVAIPDSAVARDREGRMQSLSIWTDFLASRAGNSELAADRWAGLVGAWMTDASLVADAEALERGFQALQQGYSRLEPRVRSGRLGGMVVALAEVARAASDRAYQVTWERTVEAKSWAAQMLLVIASHRGVTSTEILDQLRTSRASLDESQISRSGRTLQERGLATAGRLGRSMVWRTTPRGERAARALEQRGAGALIERTASQSAAPLIEASPAPSYAKSTAQRLRRTEPQPGKRPEPAAASAAAANVEIELVNPTSQLSAADFAERNVADRRDLSRQALQAAV